MRHFDIRITGETDADEDTVRAFIAELMCGMLASGGKIHHASLNGQEVRVRVDRIDLKTDDPDAMVQKIDATASHRIGTPPGAPPIPTAGEEPK